MENKFAETRRDVLRKAAFVSPLILTLPVFPSFAKAGSHWADDDSAHGVSYESENQGSEKDRSQNRRRRHHRSDFWAFLGM